MPASHPVHAPEATSRFFPTPVQVAARASGMVLLPLGVLRVVSGPLGYDVGVAHGFPHLTFGVLGLMLARPTDPVHRNTEHPAGGGRVGSLVPGMHPPCFHAATSCPPVPPPVQPWVDVPSDRW